ncbi:MAG: MarR family transcriptional regulator [Alphaproteobacteria bacterium]|nr:MarR family transcriptional regulator [Alphaproteobacteria bacterium]
MSYSDLYLMPGHLIRRAQQIAVSIFTEEFAGFGITPVQFALLCTVRDHPGIEQISLANLVAFDRSNTGDVIARLQEKGLVRRVAGDADRRTKLVNLTQEGAKMLEAVQPALETSQERILAPLDAQEQEAFMALLTKLVDVNNLNSRAPRRPRVHRRPGGSLERAAG